MNKQIKSIVATVIVLMLGAYSLSYLHAEEVNESKLTNLSYVKKTYKTNCKYIEGKFYYHYSSDGKAVFCKAKLPEVAKGMIAKIGTVNVNGEIYGRVVFHAPGIITYTYNLHDTKCSVKGKLAANVSEEKVENAAKQFKELAIDLATEFKKKN